MERLTAAANAVLMAIVAEHDVVTPEQVIDVARDRRSPLHRYFEWDDSAAAHEYRIEQARRVLRMHVVVVDANLPPVRALVSLSSDRLAHGGYRSLRAVLEDPARRAVLLEDALQSFAAYQAKYERLRELAELWPVAQKIASKARRGKGGARKAG